jgi:tetratricopeptide (TPR) repeat protein
MFTNWLQQLVPKKGNLPPVTLPPPPPNISAILPAYEQALHALNGREPETLFATLLVRDQLEAVRQRDTAPAVPVMQQLIGLDEQLRQQVTAVFLPSFAQWRRSVRPPQAHWWWYLDEAAAEKEQEKDFLWHLLAVTFFILTVPLATDIIRRLWAHAPDNVAIVSTLLTLLITASPFTKNGRELIQWLLWRVSFLPTHRHATTMATTAFVALLFVSGLYFIYLPRLAIFYNDQGVIAIQQGQLNVARQNLQRAIAINNDLAPSYYNLAAAYEKAGWYEEAINRYQQALDYDLQFAPAYNNIGRLYLQQGQPTRAQEILIVGLTVLDSTPPSQQETLVTRYRLLTHLGQAYYEQGEYDLAALTLEEVIALEKDGVLDVRFFAARPHYYLARSYEALERPSADIISQWEMALNYLDTEDPISWRMTITQQLSLWREYNSE